MRPFLFIQNMKESKNFEKLYIITDEMLSYCEDYLEENGEYPKDFGDLLHWMNF